MASCDPDTGCKTVSTLREALAEQRTEAALHSERLRVAAERGEKMVESFQACLESIQSHSLSLNDGARRMEKIEEDVNRIGQLQRDHELRIDCQLKDHEESPSGLHVLEKAAIYKDMRLHSRAITGLSCVTGGIVLFLLVSDHGQAMLHAIEKWVGFA